jgi:hypothetical protein
MGGTSVVKMDPKRFEALVGYTRNPLITEISRELAWYSNKEETVLGVLLFDFTDREFGGIILGRDEGGRYRAIETDVCFDTQQAAHEWIEDAIERHTASGMKVFPQGEACEPMDLFTPVVSPERLHPFFANLNEGRSFRAAKQLIQELMPHYTDIDGNFVEQFQSTGFDSRLWELYLYTYLVEERFNIDRTHNAPDFMVSKGQDDVAIECCIVGRKDAAPISTEYTDVTEEDAKRINASLENEMPIRFGSALYSKLRKKYWDLAHVAGKPIVFAIADFHEKRSMLWSHSALIPYLYGVKHDWHRDKDGNVVTTTTPIASHKEGIKCIPSGFFNQPDAEKVSAVLFTACATINKFNRMGRQSGFGDPSIIMQRMGTCYDEDPKAAEPKIFSYRVDETSQETWAEGLSMFHNPRAERPIEADLFPSIAHHFFKNDRLVGYFPPFHPFSSITQILIPGKDRPSAENGR